MSTFETRLFINGAYVVGEGAVQPAHEPATGTLLADVASASPTQIDRAVQAADDARQAYAAWRHEELRLRLGPVDAVTHGVHPGAPPDDRGVTTRV